VTPQAPAVRSTPDARSGLARSPRPGEDGRAEQGRFVITTAPLDSNALEATVTGPECGAGSIFVGRVRAQNEGRAVLWLDYEAYAPLAIATFERIAQEAADRWPGATLAIAHRVGRLAIGEASVVVAAGSPHRREAFAACRYGIERVKQIAPIWKREHFEGGDVWIEGATADPDDEAAREMAASRAWS
jgi:molybdopterin synthase catalytic subunit